MRILADKDIPYIYRLFGQNNQVEVLDGRSITARHVESIDGLIVRSVTKVNQKLLDNSSVKFIGTVTSGTDHIDQNYLKKRNIKFIDSSGSNAIAVVEYVLTALFWLARRDGFFLRDKTIGIVGLGNIGSLLYQRLSYLGVHTLLCDPPLALKNVNLVWNSLETLVSESDILTLHTSLLYTGKYSTWHMINLDVLEALSANTILINTCRGAVIDNNALLRVLECGKKLNVVLDVWESEPVLSLPLLSYSDIGTAHIAGYTLESKIRSVLRIHHVYCDYFDIVNKVNLSDFLLPLKIHNINIKTCDEYHINQVLQYMHDIHHDHITLKRVVLYPGGFDALRRFYFNRREWSALHVQSDTDSSDEMLINLGFATCYM